jgi:hypothetical protein
MDALTGEHLGEAMPQTVQVNDPTRAIHKRDAGKNAIAFELLQQPPRDSEHPLPGARHPLKLLGPPRSPPQQPFGRAVRQ